MTSGHLSLEIGVFSLGSSQGDSSELRRDPGSGESRWAGQVVLLPGLVRAVCVVSVTGASV